MSRNWARAEVYAIVVVFAIVAVFSVGVVFYAKRANDAATGAARASCVLVKVIEESADTAVHSADTQRKIIEKLPKRDPTLPTRRKQEMTVRKQVQSLNGLARDMRENVDCPRRVASLK